MSKLLLLLLLVAWPAMAEEALRLDVKGEISVDRNGSVRGYEIKTALTPEITSLLDRSVRQWKFEPMLRDGAPAYVRNDMYVSLVAAKVSEGYRLRIERVRFGGTRKARRMDPPRYPMEALRKGLSATVLVALRISPKGDVLEAAVAQSALTGVKASQRAADNWLGEFDRMALAAAKRWKYEAADPAAGDMPETTQLVPVEFTVDSPVAPEGWQYASAGIAHPIPWLPPQSQAYDATGLKQGESLALDSSLKLAQDVIGKTL